MKIEKENISKIVEELKVFRSGIANDVREGWDFRDEVSDELQLTLYECSAILILELEKSLSGSVNKPMMILVKTKLEKLVKSENFKFYDKLGACGINTIVTSGTKYFVRVMFESLKYLGV